MRGLVAVILAIMTGMFCSVVTYLPEIGDANTAPNQHVTPTYISRSAEDTGSPNIVTGVIIDYRGFDTMWETSVMFLAGLTTVLVLTSNPVGRRPEEEPEDPEEGEIIQAGALLSVGVLLARLILGFDTKFNVLGKTSVVLAGVGTFLYAFTGWLTLFGGADFFLNYNYMPIHMEPQHEMHAMGIFLIEIGVAICVMMTIINLLDAIVKRGDEDGSAQ